MMFRENPLVEKSLQERNDTISKFWLSEPCSRMQIEPKLLGRKVILVDAEDAFTQMLAQQMTAIGLKVIIKNFNNFFDSRENYDLIVMGPGPGDPNNLNDIRIGTMRKIIIHIINARLPFLAICLSHQILCLELGIDVIRKSSPNQGVQRQIDFFGKQEFVGFYNTYVGIYDESILEKFIEVSFDTLTHEIHALRSSKFISMQFHPESLLTKNGINIINSSIKQVLCL